MKKMIIALVLICLVVSVCACGGETDAETTVADTAAVTEAADTTEAAVESEAAEVDLSNPDAVVEFGDYEGQQALSKSIQNLEMTGKVVSIDGTFSVLGTSHVIGQSNGNGESVGTVITVEGYEDADYPADGAHVQLVGVVVTEGLTSTISVKPENITVVE